MDELRLRWRFGRMIAVVFAVVLMGVTPGLVCAAVQKDRQAEQFGDVKPGARIVVMHPDIKMFIVTTQGVPQERTEWAKAAEHSFMAALKTFAADHSLNVTFAEQDAEASRYERLYTVVADSILTHHVGPAVLPTKGTTFDWTLGPGIAELGTRYSADYGLFITYRSYRAKSGRWANEVAGAVMLRVPTGSEVASAALVDMHTGAIVWFNPFNAAGLAAGDIRNADDANASVTRMLDEWPNG